MHNSFLIEIIQALGEEARQDAQIFLASPYFNRASNAADVLALFQAIIQTAPEFEAQDLKRERIYGIIYPGKPWVPGKLDKIMTELKKQLRLFVLTEDYFLPEKEEILELQWVAWLRRKGMGEKSKLAFDKIKKKERQELAPGDLLLLKIAEEESEGDSYGNDLSSDLRMPNLIHQLDMYYYLYRANCMNIVLQQQKVSSSANVSFLFRDVTYYESHSSILRMIRMVGHLLQKEQPDVADVERLLALIIEIQDKLPNEILKVYYTYLRNVCTLLIDAGNLEYIPVLHQIHKRNLESGYFNIEGKIHVNAYLNIVQIALRAKEINWALELTEKYKENVYGEEHERFYYQINLAYCLFAEGKFEEALGYIPDVQSSPHYYLMTRRLELKAYYELGSDLLPYKMDSFRKFIERTAPKSIASNVRTMNLNFIYILNQLSQSPPKDRKRAEKILQRIEERPLLGERTWLIEKANSLK